MMNRSELENMLCACQILIHRDAMMNRSELENMLCACQMTVTDMIFPQMI